MPIETLADIVRVHGRERPDKPALIFGDRTTTYRELDQRSSRVATGLVAEGIAGQTRIAVLDKNFPEFFEVTFGASKCNAVTVAVNWRLSAREVAEIVNDSQSAVFVVGEEFAPVLDEIEDQLTTVKKILVRGSHPRHQGVGEWVDSHEPVDREVPSAPGDVAAQYYTSGTTGLPKGVMLSNANNVAALPGIADELGLSEDVVSLVVMPLFHVAGAGWATLGLYLGGTNVLMADVDPAGIIAAIPEHGITHAVFVPAVLQFLLLTPGVDEADFSSLEMILYGASPISDEVLRGSLGTLGCRFAQLYGLTETTAMGTLLPPEDHDPDGPGAHRLRSAGKPRRNTELRVVDPDTLDDVPKGDVGEILIRSPGNMLGYWNQPEETARTLLADGWLRTGDAGYLDDDGYLYIHDRVKDMIVTGGENVYPAEVENVLMSHPAVADCAVIGVPDEHWGETAKALVVKAEGAEVAEDELIEHCRADLAHFKCPTSVEFIESVPRNPTGKILRKDLRAPYWEGRQRKV